MRFQSISLMSQLASGIVTCHSICLALVSIVVHCNAFCEAYVRIDSFASTGVLVGQLNDSSVVMTGGTAVDLVGFEDASITAMSTLSFAVRVVGCTQ